MPAFARSGACAAPSTPGSATRSWSVTTLLIAGSLLLSSCQPAPRAESQQIEQLNLKIQQMEQRLNKLSERHDGSDRQGKPPAGVIKSLTIRTGTEDDRLRIYWGDGSTTDLPCTKEQATFVCG